LMVEAVARLGGPQVPQEVILAAEALGMAAVATEAVVEVGVVVVAMAVATAAAAAGSTTS